MEDRLIKLISYLGLLALIVYAVASAFGKRDELHKKPSPVGCTRKANGAVWARYSVPAPSVVQPAGVAPQVRR